MRFFKKPIICFTLAAIFLIMVGGCGEETEENLVEKSEDIWINREKPEDYEEPVSYEGKERSPLTGEWIAEEIAGRRPAAVTINNSFAALPQSGLSSAGVIYETLAEGSITRLVAVFQELDASRIGAVRSARHYYLDFAYDFDAVFIHYGGSPQAYSDISSMRAPSLNGLSYLDGLLTWRDPERRKQPGMYEHSVFTSGERILEAWERVGYRKEFSEKWEPPFRFEEDNNEFSGKPAREVIVPFSSSYTIRFEYDSEEEEYLRFQAGEPHIDENDGSQIAVKNILVQFTDIYVIPGDDEGRRNVVTVGNGRGLHITGGRAREVYWERSSRQEPTSWTNDQGDPLSMDSGSVWICVFPKNRSVEIN